MGRFVCGALLSAVLVAGCSSGAPTPSPTSSTAPSSTSPSSTSPSTPPSPATSSPSAPPASSSSTPAVRWRHVVVVVMENRDSSSITGNTAAPYLNELERSGLNFTDMHAEAHPSQPNYVALFSGSTQGLTDDTCPHTYAADNLGHQLRAAGSSFIGYAERLPHSGYTGCNAYPYARRHVPWIDFSDLPGSVSQPLSAMPADFDALPDVAFVVPDVINDMHDGSIAQGDAWLRQHLSSYVTWARSHGSLLIVTWDEDEGSSDNHIATMAVGAGVTAGRWTKRADHYSVLRIIEDNFGLPHLGKAATATPVGPLS